MHLFAHITGDQAIRLQLGTSFHINTILDGIAADPRCLKDNNSINLFKSGVAKGFVYMLHVLTLPDLR